MAVYNQSLLSPDPLYLQPKSYDARSDRKWFADIMGPGVLNAADFAITYSGGTLVLNYAAGIAYVLGGNIADQGMYRQFVSAGSTVTCPAADPTNPRIDTIILRVMDNAADASGFNEARIECVPGTPTAGATLVNLNGKNPLTALGEASKSFTVLAYILVPAGATVLTNTATNVKDARTRSSVGGGTSNASGFPIGGTLEWNSTTLPAAGTWLVEDGSAINRLTFATAFGYLGIVAGAGDGVNTFNIPDSRGRSAVGYVPSGGHTDVSTMFLTEGVAVGFRRMKHRTSNTLAVVAASTGITNVRLDGGAGGATTVVVPQGARLDGGNLLTDPTHVHTLSGAVGTNVANDPLDTPAYIVKNKILRVA